MLCTQGFRTEGVALDPRWSVDGRRIVYKVNEPRIASATRWTIQRSYRWNSAIVLDWASRENVGRQPGENGSRQHLTERDKQRVQGVLFCSHENCRKLQLFLGIQSGQTPLEEALIYSSIDGILYPELLLRALLLAYYNRNIENCSFVMILGTNKRHFRFSPLNISLIR